MHESRKSLNFKVIEMLAKTMSHASRKTLSKSDRSKSLVETRNSLKNSQLQTLWGQALALIKREDKGLASKLMSTVGGAATSILSGINDRDEGFALSSSSEEASSRRGASQRTGSRETPQSKQGIRR